MKTSIIQQQDFLNRRIFLRNGGLALGATALSGLLPQVANGAVGSTFPNFPAKAKRVIYLFQSGAPSQMDLFDPKPGMEKVRCLLYTSPSPRDRTRSRMPSSA